MAIARLQKDLQEHKSLRTTTASDHRPFEELKEIAQDQKLSKIWRGLVVAIEPEDTLELRRRKNRVKENEKLRSHKYNGS